MDELADAISKDCGHQSLEHRGCIAITHLHYLTSECAKYCGKRRLMDMFQYDVYLFVCFVMHANCNAIGFSRANILMPVACMNSRDNNTPSLLLSNRQCAFTRFISQYPVRVWLSEGGHVGHSLCLDL